MRGIKIADSMLDLVGDIPLVRLNRVGRETGAEILVKPEFLNPSGSIKDRIAKRMVEDAERMGDLRPGRMIIEATTGNTGTALAFVAAVKGYEMIAFSPERVANRTRSAIMLAYGAEARVVTDVKERTDASERGSGDASVHGGRVELLPRQASRDLERRDERVWWARQFANASNADAHRESTGGEILDQTDGRLDAFVASVGTGGTLLGVGERLKAHDSRIQIVGVEPAGSGLLTADDQEFVPGISDGFIKQLVEGDLVDRVISITNEEAIEMAHQLAEQEGIFAGISSGANVAAALVIAKERGPGARIVTVLPDSRDRYLEVELYTT
jgi:cysteine synthase A